MLFYLLGHVLLAEYATVPPQPSAITLNLTLKVIVVGFGDGHGALEQDTGMKTYSHYIAGALLKDGMLILYASVSSNPYLF